MTTGGHLNGAEVTRRSFVVAGLSGFVWAAAGAPMARAQDKLVLVGVIEEDPSVMNPAITATISSFATGSPVYEALTHINPDGSIDPELAESWEISDDGLSYTFHLRPGVAWHDGTPFTSADVKFSIENANKVLHPWGRGAFRSIESIETPDDLTVVFRLGKPQASLIFGTDGACGSILPKHLWENETIATSPLNHQPVGTGPFQFVEYVPGEFVRYARNESYHGKRPAYDEVVLRIISDPAARLAALPNIEVKTTDLRGTAYLGTMNNEAGPCSNADVRRAITYAIDRAFIRDNVAPGYALHMVGPLPPVSPLADSSLEDYPFDPARAEEMLDAAGYPRGGDGTRFEFRLLWPNYDPVPARAGDIIYRNLGDVGIKVVLTPLESAALIQRGHIGREFDMMLQTYGLGPDPDIGVERLYNSGNIHEPAQPFTNGSGYRNAEVDRLFEEQRTQTDFVKRKAIYSEIQRLIWADVPVLPVLGYTAPNAFNTDYVTGLYDLSYGHQEDYKNAVPSA
jgi:peptide/nickel transport system substrate-binding protein